MKPPASVRIGPHEWTVRRQPIDADGEYYGRTVERELAILIAPGNAPSQERDTMLHELLHAIWAHTGLDYDDEQQEQIVRSLSTPLLGALRDNPRLVTFLLDAP